MKRLITLAPIALMVSGVFLLAQTLFGMLAMLGLDLTKFQDVFLVLCLTMAFPIYLLAIKSLRIVVGLWVFFLVQWADMCMISSPPHFGNPLYWWRGDVLFIAIVLAQLSYIAQRLSGKEKNMRLSDAFQPA
jgi:hypothetical protein